MVVICDTYEEAQEVNRLQPLIASIDMSQPILDIARFIASSSLVCQTLQSVDRFYPVAYGIPETAVYHNWYISCYDCISYLTHSQ